MLEYQAQQQQLQQVSALVERVLGSIEQLREALVRYENALPVTSNKD